MWLGIRQVLTHDSHSSHERLIKVRIMLIPSHSLPYRIFLRMETKCSIEKSCSANCHQCLLLMSMDPFTLLMNCCKTNLLAILFLNPFFLATPDVTLGGTTHGMEYQKELHALEWSVEQTDIQTFLCCITVDSRLAGWFCCQQLSGNLPDLSIQTVV